MATARVSVPSAFRRGALTSFVSRHRVLWEGVMAGLTAVYVALSFFEDATSFTFSAYSVALFVMSGVFLIEFCVRFWDAPNRLHYLRGHWIDLLTSFPLVGPFRA